LEYKKALKHILSFLFNDEKLQKAIFKIRSYRHSFRRLNPFVSKKYIYKNNTTLISFPGLKTHKITSNLIVLGAQRCGTTSFHNYLNMHPDIFMSKPVKEPCFYLPINFVQERRKVQGFYYENHDDLFKNCMIQGYMGQKIFGESSTFYTMGDVSRKYEVQKKIKRTNPETKFIYLVRNPFSRIISHYKQSEKSKPLNDINSFLKSDYYAFSNTRYFYQLEEYLKVFPKDQFKVIVFEDMINRKETILNECFDFLGLAAIKDFKRFIIYNNSNVQDKNQIDKMKFSEETHEKLLSYLEPEFEQIQNLFNLDMDIWDLSSKTWCK